MVGTTVFPLQDVKIDFHFMFSTSELAVSKQLCSCQIPAALPCSYGGRKCRFETDFQLQSKWFCRVGFVECCDKKKMKSFSSDSPFLTTSTTVPVRFMYPYEKTKKSFQTRNSLFVRVLPTVWIIHRSEKDEWKFFLQLGKFCLETRTTGQIHVVLYTGTVPYKSALRARFALGVKRIFP